MLPAKPFSTIPGTQCGEKSAPAAAFPQLKKKKKKDLFIWMCWVLVAACRIFSCSMWDLVLWPGINPGPPALGAQSLSHWTTRKVYPASLLKPVFPTCKLEVKFFFSTFISPTPPAPNMSTLSL